MNKITLNIYSEISEEIIHSYNIVTTLDPNNDDFTEEFETGILNDIFTELNVDSSNVYYEVI
tara:strand:+ start:288 stop:473 length:186 start_codon:yes stop_codon:yes gene_type:complete